MRAGIYLSVVFWALAKLASAASIDSLQSKGLHLLYSQPDSALYFFSQASVLARQQGNLAQEALALNRMGVVHKNLGQHPQALGFFRKSLNIRLRLKDSAGIASVYNNLGNTFKNAAAYDSALHYALQCMQLRKMHAEQQRKLPKSLINLGNIYGLLKQWKESKQHYQLALEQAIITGDKPGQALANYSLAHVLMQEDSLAEAEHQLEKSLLLEKKLGQERNLARNYNAFGVLSEKGNDPHRAERFFRLSLSMYKELNSHQDIPIAYLNLGNAKRSQSQPDSAQAYYLLALQHARKLGQPQTAKDVHEHLYWLQEQEGRPKLALKHYKAHIAIKDSLFNAQSVQAFNEIKERYLAAERQQQIVRQQAAISQKTWERNTAMASAAALLLLGSTFFLLYQQRQKHLGLLARQETANSLQRITAQLKEKELQAMEASLKGQAQERQRIAADLHDQLGSLLATIKLYFNGMLSGLANTDQATQERYGKAQELIDIACGDVRGIAHNMGSGMLIQSGLKRALTDLCQTLNETEALEVSFYEHGVESTMEIAAQLDLYRIILELVSNVIRHAQATELTVQLNQTDEGLNLIIEDDGQGFNPSQATGMGLKNIAARVARLNGQFSIDSQQGHGTTSIINIPIE